MAFARCVRKTALGFFFFKWEEIYGLVVEKRTRF
jgi:hypothetical protein